MLAVCRLIRFGNKWLLPKIGLSHWCSIFTGVLSLLFISKLRKCTSMHSNTRGVSIYTFVILLFSVCYFDIVETIGEQSDEMASYLIVMLLTSEIFGYLQRTFLINVMDIVEEFKLSSYCSLILSHMAFCYYTVMFMNINKCFNLFKCYVVALSIYVIVFIYGFIINDHTILKIEYSGRALYPNYLERRGNIIRFLESRKSYSTFIVLNMMFMIVSIMLSGNEFVDAINKYVVSWVAMVHCLGMLRHGSIRRMIFADRRITRFFFYLRRRTTFRNSSDDYFDKLTEAWNRGLPEEGANRRINARRVLLGKIINAFTSLKNFIWKNEQQQNPTNERANAAYDNNAAN